MHLVLQRAIRRVVRPVGVLLTGMAISTLVAWGCALYVEGDDGSWMPFGEFSTTNQPGASYEPRDAMAWPVLVPSTWEPRPERASRRVGPGLRIERYSRWGGGPGHQVHYTTRAGWPMHSHRAVLFHEKPSDLSPGWVVRMYRDRPLTLLGTGLPARWLPSWATPAWDRWDNVFEWRRLPLAPVLPGLVINSLLYASVVWLLLVAGRRMRWYLRSRRGLCPRCAYDRGALPTEAPCPECAHAPA